MIPPLPTVQVPRYTVHTTLSKGVRHIGHIQCSSTALSVKQHQQIIRTPTHQQYNNIKYRSRHDTTTTIVPWCDRQRLYFCGCGSLKIFEYVIWKSTGVLYDVRTVASRYSYRYSHDNLKIPPTTAQQMKMVCCVVL